MRDGVPVIITEQEQAMPEWMAVTLAATALGLVLTGCASNTEPETPGASKHGASVASSQHGEAKAGVREERVTVYVEGMTKLRGIT
jgi:hypothetical protein